MDDSVRVVFHPLNVVVNVPRYSSVLDAIRSAGIQFESICGGRGECKKCRVIHTRGDCTAGSPESTRGLSKAEVEQRVCLACQTVLLGDCEFFIPVESRIDTPKILHGTLRDDMKGTPAVMKFLVGFDSWILPVGEGRRSFRLLGYTGRRPHIPPVLSQRLTSFDGPCTSPSRTREYTRKSLLSSLGIPLPARMASPLILERRQWWECW